MKKVLLIGELNEIVRSINECLMGDFQIQLSSAILENVQGMMKIIRPSLVIVNLIGMQEVDLEILEYLAENRNGAHVLLVCSPEEWDFYRETCEELDFERVFRPVRGDRIRHICFQMLGMEEPLGEQSETEVKIRKRILVVDDSAIVLRNVTYILEEEYDVITATSGKQAYKMIPEVNPDLVLLDYGMPGWDGLKTFEEIKAYPGYEDLPVVFLTGVAQRKRIYAVLKNRPAGYILKPPDQERIMTTLREVLGE